eukprot:10772689-Heterocapsa_arctica.AAC.1
MPSSSSMMYSMSALAKLTLKSTHCASTTTNDQGARGTAARTTVSTQWGIEDDVLRIITMVPQSSCGG